MNFKLTQQDIKDANRINEIFLEISDRSKDMILVYASAIRDKEISDTSKQPA